MKIADLSTATIENIKLTFTACEKIATTDSAIKLGKYINLSYTGEGCHKKIQPEDDNWLKFRLKRLEIEANCLL